jgi:NADH-quinone oxidoreductase subunit A
MEPLNTAVALSPWQPGIFSLAIYILVVVGLVAVLLWLSSWLGTRLPSTEKSRPYECGVIPTGKARLRYPVPFFLVAIFFLIFDVEGAYIFSWAVAWDSLGWSGWMQMAFFIFVLLLGLVYIWRKGGLEWGPTRPKR